MPRQVEGDQSAANACSSQLFCRGDSCGLARAGSPETEETRGTGDPHDRKPIARPAARPAGGPRCSAGRVSASEVRACRVGLAGNPRQGNHRREGTSRAFGGRVRLWGQAGAALGALERVDLLERAAGSLSHARERRISDACRELGFLAIRSARVLSRVRPRRGRSRRGSGQPRDPGASAVSSLRRPRLTPGSRAFRGGAQPPQPGAHPIVV